LFSVKEKDMYAIFDWMTQGLVVDIDGSVQMFDTETDAIRLGSKELHNGLWTVIPIPLEAAIYLD
jgi:hypothetical protein